MVATPHKQTNETPLQPSRNRNRQSTTSRRRAKSRDQNPGIDNPDGVEEVISSQDAGTVENPAIDTQKQGQTLQVVSDYQIGDIVAYTNAPDRPMKIIEILGDRFRIKRLHDGAKFYVYRSLVVSEMQEVANSAATISEVANSAATFDPNSNLENFPKLPNLDNTASKLGKQIYSELGGDVAALEDELNGATIASDNNRLHSECEDQGSLLIAPHSSLDYLIADLNILYERIEQAETVAMTAAHSALEFARQMGGKLLQAKAEAGHGNWEKVREQILSPRTGKPIPSSTATLYMRIFEGWDTLETNAIATIREASEALKKPRLNPQPVAEMQPVIHEKSLVDSLEGLQSDFHQRKAIAEAATSEGRENSPDYESSSISGWQQGDRLTPKGGGIEGVVVSATDKAVVINQDDGRTVTSTRMSPAEVAKKFDPVVQADSLKWLDDEFEQAIELVTEYLGPEQVKKLALQVMQAVRDLGGLPVGILAIRECDRDELLQMQEIVKRMLETT